MYFITMRLASSLSFYRDGNKSWLHSDNCTPTTLFSSCHQTLLTIYTFCTVCNMEKQNAFGKGYSVIFSKSRLISV